MWKALILPGIITLAVVTVWAQGVHAGAPAPIPEAAGASLPEVQIANLGPFEFENGQSIENLQVTFVTFGRLNENRDNVVLSLHPFTSDFRYIVPLVGPGKPLDSDKYFIVAPDYLGNSQLRSPLTTGPTNSGLLMHFPKYSVADWVAVEHRLLTQHLGISRVRAVIGSSIGAMKAYQFAVSYPDFAEAIIPVAGSPATSPETRAILKGVRAIIEADAGWRNGFYTTNPSVNLTTALMSLVPWWFSRPYFEAEVATPDQEGAYDRFWQTLWGVNFPQDARDVHYSLRAWADFDVGNTRGFDGDTAGALKSIKAKALLIAITDDRLIPPSEMRAAHAHIPGARFEEVPSAMGHLASIWLDPEATERIGGLVAEFIAGAR